MFLDVDPTCFQQILQYLRLRANLSHPEEEVPQPHVPSDRFFTYANLVKFFCLEEYMGYWSKDVPDFHDVQPGICVLGQQAMVTADDLQIRTMYIGEPMQAKQTYHVKFRVDKACQVVGICEQANDGPNKYVGHCVYYATAAGWEADAYTGCIFSDGMKYKEGGSRYPESYELEDEDNDVQDVAAWTTGTEVILRADLVDGTLTLQTSQLPYRLSMEINIPDHPDTVLRFQVMLGPSAKVDLLPVTNLEISRMQ